MELNPNYPFLTPSPKHLSHKTPTNTKQHNTNTYYWEGWQGAGRQLFFTNQNNANLKPLVLRGALESCRVGDFDGKRPLFFLITDLKNTSFNIQTCPFSRTTQPLPLSPLLSPLPSTLPLLFVLRFQNCIKLAMPTHLIWEVLTDWESFSQPASH